MNTKQIDYNDPLNYKIVHLSMLARLRAIELLMEKLPTLHKFDDDKIQKVRVLTDKAVKLTELIDDRAKTVSRECAATYLDSILQGINPTSKFSDLGKVEHITKPFIEQSIAAVEELEGELLLLARLPTL